MYKIMLVSLDGSELAEVVFPHAKELAARLDMEVRVLHVVSPDLRRFTPVHQAYVERAASIIRREAQNVQKQIGTMPGGKPVKVKGEVFVGYAPEEILQYADKNNIDLVVIATHGRSGRKRWMGNVADKILRSSKIPVWLVHAGIEDEIPYDQWPKKTLLVLLDGSELAEMILPHVETLARQHSTEPIEIVLLRVSEPPTVPSYYAPELPDASLNWGEFVQQEMVRSKRAATEYLAGVEERLKEKGLTVRSAVLVGKAADEISDYANKNPFSIICMVTHGRSGLNRWVFGSTAENILQGVSNPVLLIRPNKSE